MKLIPFVSIAALLALLPLSQAQQDFDPSGDSVSSNAPKSIRVYVEYYEVSTLEYAEIMTEEKIGTNDTKLRNSMLQKAKAGTAKFVDSQTIVALPGEKATTESITEYIYPTEYEPPYLKVEDEKEKSAKINTLSSPTPTAFDKRNLGSTLNVEPGLGDDGKTVDLNFSPEMAYLIGETIWGTSADSKVTMKMPTIYTYRVETAVTVTKGQFHMVSALTPKDDNNKADPTKKLLVFVKADILTVGR